MRWVLLIALLATGCTAATVEEKKMDDKIREKIVEAVRADHGWKTEEVRVDEVDRLRRGTCSFYTAGNTVRPLSYQLNYAAIQDQIISIADEKAVSKIVDACGTDAPAGWWAEIVTRFHQDLGSGIVLNDEKQNAGALRKIQEANKKFTQPALTGDNASRSVEFYMLEPESYTVYAIQASRTKDGTFLVTRTEL